MGAGVTCRMQLRITRRTSTRAAGDPWLMGSMEVVTAQLHDLSQTIQLEMIDFCAATSGEQR
jgi:hypothetical protein